MKTFFRIAAVAAVLTVSAAAASASTTELAINGNFENGQTGWIFTGNVHVAPGNIYAQYGWTDANYPNGNVALFGDRNQPGGSIAQTLTTVAGQDYKLVFDYGAITGNGREQDTIVSVFDGTDAVSHLAGQQFSAYGTGSLAHMMTTHELDFTAMSNKTMIKFSDANIKSTVDIDAVIDNVSVNAVRRDAPANVPEPGTLALLGVAGVALAWTQRRRRLGAAVQ